jgi:hypothetical protein
VCARVSTLVGPPDQVDELANYAAERVMPAFRDLDGFNGLLALADRQRGRVLVWVSGRQRRPWINSAEGQQRWLARP